MNVHRFTGHVFIIGVGELADSLSLFKIVHSRFMLRHTVETPGISKAIAEAAFGLGV